MMFPQLPSPEIIGAALVIGSAVFSGFYISTVERAKQRKDSKVAEIEKQLFQAREAITRSYQFYEPALTRLLVLQSTQSSHTNSAHWMPEIGKHIVQGVLERYSAAKGVGPSQDEFRKIEQTAQRAFLRSDTAALQSLSKLSSDLIQEWSDRHISLVNERIELSAQSEKLNRRAVNSRYAAVALQILGAIVVLAKNVSY